MQLSYMLLEKLRTGAFEGQAGLLTPREWIQLLKNHLLEPFFVHKYVDIVESHRSSNKIFSYKVEMEVGGICKEQADISEATSHHHEVKWQSLSMLESS